MNAFCPGEEGGANLPQINQILHRLRGLDMTQRQTGRLSDHSVLGLQTLLQVDDGRDVIGARSGQRDDGHRLYVDVTVGQKVNQCLDNGGAFVFAFNE